MKTTSRKRAPKSLPPAVSDLVAEGGNILATDDANTLTVTPAEVVGHAATPSPSEKTPPAQAKPRTVATR
jgi:hypothetical protein